MKRQLTNGLTIFIGGVLGGIFRAVLEQQFPTSHLPWTTLVINCIGAFLLVMINAWLARRFALPEAVIVGLGTGVMGGFTTFSTWMLESIKLMMTHQITIAGLYLLLSIAIGLLASIVGFQLANWLLNRKGFFN